MKNNILEFIIKIKTDPENLKKALIILVLIIVGVFGSIAYFAKSNDSKSDENSLKIEESADANGESKAAGDVGDDSSTSAGSINAVADVMYIDVAGAVTNPGVIILQTNSRVFEAIDAAGGLLANANTQTINKAAILNDGERVYIPTNEEVKNGDVPSDSSSANTSSGSASAGNSVNSNGKVNINTADSDTLQQLNGVGPSTAQKIIDYRNSNGKFKKIEDIKNVSGIGDKTYEKLKNHISI